MRYFPQETPRNVTRDGCLALCHCEQAIYARGKIRFERVRSMTSISGRSLLVAFWVAFLVAGISAALAAPISVIVGGAAQLALAVIWIGYPVGLFYSFAGQRARLVGVPLMICGALAGYVLSVFVYDKDDGVARSTVAPLLGAVLILIPFVAGAWSLKDGEKRTKVGPTANVVLTALALFALPFFGAYVHERFCRTRSGTYPGTHVGKRTT